MQTPVTPLTNLTGGTAVPAPPLPSGTGTVPDLAPSLARSLQSDGTLGALVSARPRTGHLTLTVQGGHTLQVQTSLPLAIGTNLNISLNSPGTPAILTLTPQQPTSGQPAGSPAQAPPALTATQQPAIVTTLSQGAILTGTITSSFPSNLTSPPQTVLQNNPVNTGLSGPPAQTAQAPIPAQAAQAPALAQTTQVPAPAQTTQAPIPAQTTQAPAPAQTAQAPAPAQTTQAPIPAQTTQAPAPAQTAQAPAPAQTAQAQAPAQTAQAPALAQTTQAPALAQTAQAPALAQTTQAPALAQTAQAPAPAQTAQVPALAQTTQAQAPVQTAQAQAPVQTAQALPPGTTVQLRLLALIPPGQSHSASGPVGSFSGLVSSQNAGGATTLQTPLGNIIVSLPNQPPAGTKLLLNMVGEPRLPTFPASDTPQAPTARFQVLQETLTQIRTNDTITAQRITQSLIPQPNGLLGMAALLLANAIRQGHVGRWLGTDGIRALDVSGKRDILSRLQTEIRQSQGRASDGAGQEWRVTTLPFMNDSQIEQIRLYTKDRPEQDAEGRDQTASENEARRFVIEADFSRLGPVQLDGFTQNKSVELKIRTYHPFEGSARDEIRALFYDTVTALGLTGSVEFTVVPKFDLKPNDTSYSPEGITV